MPGIVARIGDLTAPPVPGRFYLVPTVRYIWHGVNADWPVLGPKHTDADILNFPHPHYHVDLRFISARVITHFSGRSHWGAAGLSVRPLCHASREGTVPHPEPVWRRRLCRLQAAPTPRDLVEFVIGHQALLPALEAAYQDARVMMTPQGPVCPHRYAPLGTVPPDCNGHVVCPLHGLKWDLATGHMVPSELVEG